MPWSYILTFVAGLIIGAAGVLLYKLLQFLADLKATQHALAAYDQYLSTEADAQARAAVENAKKRLRWQKNINPAWLPPLVDEIPRLVREIAAIYHPGKENSLLAPGLSQFSRAVHLASMDIADFLQTRSIGRLVDVSASTALKTWEVTHKLAKHQTVQSANKWYKRLQPVWQAVLYKSPVMWASVAVSNVATRTLQPAVIDIIAKRAIDLYSGRLGRGTELSYLPSQPSETPPGQM